MLEKKENIGSQMGHTKKNIGTKAACKMLMKLTPVHDGFVLLLRQHDDIYDVIYESPWLAQHYLRRLCCGPVHLGYDPGYSDAHGRFYHPPYRRESCNECRGISVQVRKQMILNSTCYYNNNS